MSKFAAFIEKFKAGHLDAQLGNKLKELVESVVSFSEPGKLTVEINLTPKPDGEVMAKVKFRMKKPERDTMESIMFVTAENELVTSDPKQPDIFEGTPVKGVNDAPQAAVKRL